MYCHLLLFSFSVYVILFSRYWSEHSFYAYSKWHLYLLDSHWLYTECAILRRILRMVALYGCLLVAKFYHYCEATKRKISWNTFPRDSCRFERLHWKAANPLSVFEVAVLSFPPTLFVSPFEFPRNRLNTARPQKKCITWKYSVYHVESVKEYCSTGHCVQKPTYFSLLAEKSVISILYILRMNNSTC